MRVGQNLSKAHPFRVGRGVGERALQELWPLLSNELLAEVCPGNPFWKWNFEPDLPFRETRGAKTQRVTLESKASWSRITVHLLWPLGFIYL